MSSDCSSSYSYSPEFKNYIQDCSSGSSLFYIRTHSLKDNDQNKNSSADVQNDLFRNEFKRMSLRQRDKGILSKLASKKYSGFDFKVTDRHKYKHSEGELKELKISNKSTKLNKFKPRKGDNRSLFEVLFNASIIPGPDNKRLLIDRINPTSVFEKDLCVGDFIKSIDGDVVGTDNINHILQKILNKKSFKIVAQECFKDDDYDASQEEIKITKLNDIVAFKDKLFQLELIEHELIFSLNIIVKNEQITEDSDDFMTVFSYPPRENNFLHKQKGSFLTLASIMKSSFNEHPAITSIKVHNTTFFVTYTIRNGDNEYIFLGFNSNYAGLFDSKHITQNFIKYLDYVYPNFIIINDFDQLISMCEIVKIQLIRKCTDTINFEQLFSCPKFVPLPKEIVLRINDALSELEAMDYRNWNESLMELFGKFNVIGSCLFYKTSLICSHFNELDMENVELFIRHMCLKFLYEMCFVKEMAIWQRVYPKEYQSFNVENDSTRNKVFLLITARANLMMCVLLEENGYNVNPDMEIQSSNYLIYFLEEMEDVMDHLKIVGIENLTKIWINSAKRPQCKSPFEKIDESTHADHTQLRNIKEECEDDDDSEKDYESHIDSQKSSSGFDEDTIYKDFADIVPQTLTFGPDNVLYHFTQLDFAEGIILSTINDNSCKPPNDILVDAFRRCCLNIHGILQNTIKFNQLLSRENKITHKTLMLPKEQGMLIDLKLGKDKLNFWVIGRLFGTKELYVCYDSRIPQNMVEIAYRISLNCIG